jgi:hypothetical protein
LGSTISELEIENADNAEGIWINEHVRWLHVIAGNFEVTGILFFDAVLWDDLCESMTGMNRFLASSAS